MPGHYDAETVHGIINSTPVAHVSFVPDPSHPKPVVLPMIARVGSFNGQEPAVYIHGYVSARMFRPQTGRPDQQAPTRDSDAGFPVCVAATKIDNLVRQYSSSPSTVARSLRFGTSQNASL